MCRFLLAAVLSILLVPSLAHPQSLGDVARAEAVRRKAQKRPTKVYTNDNLSGTLQDGGATTAMAPAADPSAGAMARPASTAAASTSAAAKAEPVDEKQTEAYWRGRVTTIQQGLARNKVLIEAMQSRINALNAEALGADDPGRHAAAQNSLTLAMGELERLKQETEKQNKDLAATQEEARRANIPPGWLR